MSQTLPSLLNPWHATVPVLRARDLQLVVTKTEDTIICTGHTRVLLCPECHWLWATRQALCSPSFLPSSPSIHQKGFHTDHFPGTAQRQNWKPVTLYHWFSLLRVAAHFITRKQKQASRIPKWFNLVLLLLFAQRAAHVGVDKCCQLPQKVAPPSDLNHNQIHFSKTVTK